MKKSNPYPADSNYGKLFAYAVEQGRVTRGAMICHATTKLGLRLSAAKAMTDVLLAPRKERWAYNCIGAYYVVRQSRNRFKFVIIERA